MTLASLITDVREELVSFSTDLNFRDGNSTDPRNAESPVASISITNQINKAQDEILRLTGYNQTSVNLALTAGTRTYALPTTILDVLEVRISGYSIRKTTLGEITRREPLWRSVTTQGRPNRFLINGFTQIEFDIPPNAASVSAGCTLYAVTNVAALSVNSDTPTALAAPYHWLISCRAALICAEMDASNPSAQARAKGLQERYAQGMGELTAFLSARGTVDKDHPIFTEGWGLNEEGTKTNG